MRDVRYALASVWLLSSPPAADALTIDHRGAGCIVAERFPMITARVDPIGDVARARVYFRATGTPHWYFVEMRSEATAFSGVLPKPKKATKSVDYYIEVLDRAAAPSRTADHHPDVVPAADACRKEGGLAAAVAQAKVVVSATAGAPPLPPGFVNEGLVAASGGAAGAAGAAVGAAGLAAAAGGGGASTAVLVVGAVAVVGAGTAAAVVATREDPVVPTTTPPLVVAAAGTYTLVQINGGALPVLTVPFRTPPSCTGFTDSGTLTLTAQPTQYVLTLRARFVCLMGVNLVEASEPGMWSAPSSGTLSFTPTGTNLLNLGSGTLSGTTLTLPLDAPSYSPGVAGVRVTTEWRRQ